MEENKDLDEDIDSSAISERTEWKKISFNIHDAQQKN